MFFNYGFPRGVSLEANKCLGFQGIEDDGATRPGVTEMTNQSLQGVDDALWWPASGTSWCFFFSWWQFDIYII